MPGDLGMICYQDERYDIPDSSGMLIDVAVASPINKTAIEHRNSHRFPGAAAAAMEYTKFYRDNRSGDSVRLQERPWRLVPGVYEDFGRPGAHTVALYNKFAHNMVSQQRSRLCEGPMAMSAGAAEEYLKMTWHRRCVWQVHGETLYENILICWNLVHVKGLITQNNNNCGSSDIAHELQYI